MKEELSEKIDLSNITREIQTMNFNTNKDGRINFYKDTKGAEYYNWDSSNREKGLKLVSLLFAFWTIMNSSHYFEASGVEN